MGASTASHAGQTRVCNINFYVTGFKMFVSYTPARRVKLGHAVGIAASCGPERSSAADLRSLELPTSSGEAPRRTYSEVYATGRQLLWSANIGETYRFNLGTLAFRNDTPETATRVDVVAVKIVACWTTRRRIFLTHPIAHYK